MKMLPRLTILFIGVLIATFTPIFVFSRLSAEASAMNTRVNDSMITAAYDAMQVITVRKGRAFATEAQKREVLDAFYRSLSIGYFKANIGENDPMIESYIPFVMLVDNDGIYICYNREYHNWDNAGYGLPYYITPQYRYTQNYFDGMTQYTIDYTLSDLITVYKDGRKLASGNYNAVHEDLYNRDPDIFDTCPFLDEEDSYKEEKIMVITSLVQRLVNRYLNWDITGDTHESGYNVHGMQHSFTIPLGLDEDGHTVSEDWQRALAGPTVMAFYEGMQTDISVTNNYVAQIAFSGGELIKRTKYYVTLNTGYDPTDPESASAWYHTENCPEIAGDLDSARVYPSMEEAAAAGAYPCPECIR